MPSVPKILTNKTVLTGYERSENPDVKPSNKIAFYILLVSSCGRILCLLFVVSYNALILRCLLRLANSALADSALIKPMFGAAGRMGKVISPVPAKLTNKMDGAFSGNLNAFLPYGPSGLGSPNNVLKVYVRS